MTFACRPPCGPLFGASSSVTIGGSRRPKTSKPLGRARTAPREKTMTSRQEPTTHRLTRRTLLRGLGVTMALPWLESLSVWGDEPARGKSSAAPVRLAVVFAGNGFHRTEWWAKGERRKLEMGKVLQPLEPFKDRLLFIRGLYNAEAGKGGIHSAQTGNLLTGAALEGGGGIRSGISMDQLLAAKVGQETKVPSLVLGCEPP